MKSLVCELCGGNQMIKQEGLYVCQHCGTKFTPEEAKKMMIEGKVDVSGSTIKIDKTEELKNLYEIARRAKNNNNAKSAQKYYEQILIKDSGSWEANFYTDYFQTLLCNINEIQGAAKRLDSCTKSSLELINSNIKSEEKRRQAILEIRDRILAISSKLFNDAKSSYDSLNQEIKAKYTQTYVSNCRAALNLLYHYGNNVIKLYGDKYAQDVSVPCWKNGVDFHIILLPQFVDKKGNKDEIIKYFDKIKKYDPSYITPHLNTRGCYIATAIYGDYDCPQVWTLRRYRDSVLSKTMYGRMFIRLYYFLSPTLVKWFGETDLFRKVWKPFLDSFVSKLHQRGIENTIYKDV